MIGSRQAQVLAHFEAIGGAAYTQDDLYHTARGVCPVWLSPRKAGNPHSAKDWAGWRNTIERLLQNGLLEHEMDATGQRTIAMRMSAAGRAELDAWRTARLQKE